MTAEQLFLAYSVEKLKQYTARIQDCLSRLSVEQIWTRNRDSQNSVGNLVLHLCGNARQWIGSGVGGRPDGRERPAEFAARGGLDGAGLSQRISDTVADVSGIIASLSAAELLQTTTVQNYTLSKLEAIYHVIEHFSGHTGQIIFATKLLTGQDLAYYGHLSQSAPNQPNPDNTP